LKYVVVPPPGLKATKRPISPKLQKPVCPDVIAVVFLAKYSVTAAKTES